MSGQVPGLACTLAKLTGLGEEDPALEVCSLVNGGCACRGYFHCVCIVKHSPCPFISAWVPHPSCKELKLPGARAAGKRPRARGKGSPPFLGLRLGTPVGVHLPFSPSIPTLNCRVQEFKASLCEDREALGWEALLGDDKAGARIMLDKFRRTGPATPGLESLLLFDSLLLESLLVAVALGGSAGE